MLLEGRKIDNDAKYKSTLIPIAVDEQGRLIVSNGGGGGVASEVDATIVGQPINVVVNNDPYGIGEYDETDFNYISSGNGEGEVGSVVYKLAGSTVATLTYTYDAEDRIINVQRT